MSAPAPAWSTTAIRQREADETRRKASALLSVLAATGSGGMTRHVLLIDNLDSFTFNLVEAFERLGCDGQGAAQHDRRRAARFGIARRTRTR